MEPATTTIADYIDIARRRKYYIITVWIMVSIAAVIVAYYLPRTYRSTATLLMEAPVPKSLIQSALTEYAEDQIRSITQKALTTDNVLAIIEKNQLYPEDDHSGTITHELADQFKQNTEIHLVKSDLGSRETIGQSAIAFTISFIYKDAYKAKDIAGALANLFIEQNDRERAQRALRASTFLTEESDKLSEDIKSIDGRISAYKKKYKDNLPDQLQSNLAALDRAENELRDTEHQMRVAQERLMFLGVELARVQMESPGNLDNKAPLTRDEALKAMKAEYLKLIGRYNPNHPDVVRLKRQIETLDLEARDSPHGEDTVEQLIETKQNLRSLEEKGCAGNHPDILRLKNRIGALEQQLRDMEPPSGQAREVATQAVNPVYLGINAQYQSSRMELESLLQKKNTLTAKLELLQKRISSSPEVEQGYLELIRERDHAVNKYNQLKEKLLDARLVETLEKEQHGQTLTIIEQPTVPVRPEKAVRRKVAIGGFFLGIALGFGCALLVEFLDPRLRGYRALTQATGLMPLVVIPYIESPSQMQQRLMRQHHRNAALIRTGAVCILLAVIAMCLIFFTNQAPFRPADDSGQLAGTAHSPFAEKPWQP